MTEPNRPWAAWFPPQLDQATADALGQQWWNVDPHLAAALAWEAYAATLEPAPAVAQVNTGAQTVTYEPASYTGEFGLALARANWHRSFLGDLRSVPLARAHEPVGIVRVPVDLTPAWGVDP